jgi:hypothetical protein
MNKKTSLIVGAILVATIATMTLYNASVTNAQPAHVPNMTKSMNMTAGGGNMSKSMNMTAGGGNMSKSMNMTAGGGNMSKSMNMTAGGGNMSKK